MPTRRGNGFATFPLKQVALGLLVVKPKHGYELYQDFVEAFGLIWQAGQSKFYAALAALQEAGYLQSVTEPQEDRPPRKIYRLTELGHSAFLEWLYRPVTPLRCVRVEFIAKLRFFDLMALPDAERLLDAQLAVSRDTLDHWTRRAAGLREEQGDPFDELVYDFRQRQAQFIIEWLESCRATLRQRAAS